MLTAASRATPRDCPNPPSGQESARRGASFGGGSQKELQLRAARPHLAGLPERQIAATARVLGDGVLDRACYSCGQTGHICRDCPNAPNGGGGGGDRLCYNAASRACSRRPNIRDGGGDYGGSGY